MKIDLTKIYARLKAWRHERGITAKSQKAGYLVNVMEELGELAGALRCYEHIKEFLNKNKGEMCGYQHHKHSLMLIEAEHEIIDALCDICVFTINAGADIDCNEKIKIIDTIKTLQCNSNLSRLIVDCGEFNYYGSYVYFNNILVDCAEICEYYGFNFEFAMLETIKKISSLTSSYDEKTKKKEWYQANYELARI